MAIKIIKEAELTWVNIDQVDEEAVTHLRTNYNFHHLDLEDIQSENQTPKIDVYKNYIFLVLQLPHWDPETNTVISFELNIFVSDKLLITVQHGKLKEMKHFFYRCMKNRKTRREWMKENSGYLLYNLLEALFHTCRPILNNMGKYISVLEQEIFSQEPDTFTIKQLALHRRNILSFRRILDPEQLLMNTLSSIQKPFLDERLSIYFDDISDYLNKLWTILQNYKDTIDGMHISVESLINQRTNKVIRVLTAMSAALLPLTLFSGLYGMNIDHLPFANRPELVWTTFLILSCVIIGVIVFAKKRRWL